MKEKVPGPASADVMHPPLEDLIIGDSQAIATIKVVASTVARRICTVMILGETGTGKEVLARYVHAESDRRERAFVPVDCSALSDTLFESELFGHMKGAFTGAIRESLGFIRAADGGTLFLDEIGELSLPLQAKLLRAIQERQVVPVGDTRPRSVDVRIIAATNRDLAAMVREGTFRQDLFFRLNVVNLNLPPLRERSEDVLALAQHFLNLQSQLYEEPSREISARAAEALIQHNWPGNVRELSNAMEYAYAMADGCVIEVRDLPPRIQSEKAIEPQAAVSDLYLPNLERNAIVEALRRTNYCKSAAGKLLGINIQRLNRKITKLGISTP